MENQSPCFDGRLWSKPTTVKKTIENALPSVENIVTSNATPRTTEDLNISHYDLRDPDNDLLTVTIDWFQNNVWHESSVNSPTIDANLTHKADDCRAELSANDGIENGEPAHIDFLIQNTAPSLSDIQFIPSTVTKRDLITPVLIGEDIDSDQLTELYSWFVNGIEINSFDNAPLSTTLFEKGDEVQVEGRLFDGQAHSNSILSNAVVVKNAPPEISDATITPTVCQLEQPVLCSFKCI